MGLFGKKDGAQAAGQAPAGMNPGMGQGMGPAAGAGGYPGGAQVTGQPQYMAQAPQYPGYPAGAAGAKSARQARTGKKRHVAGAPSGAPRSQSIEVLAVKTSLMTDDQVAEVSMAKGGKDFGRAAVDLGYISAEELSFLEELQSRGIGVDDGSRKKGSTSLVDMENIPGSFFGPLADFIYNDDITDVDYNGRAVWVTHTDGRREKPMGKLPEKFVRQFASKIANSVNEQFNKTHPSLEAEARTISPDGEEISLRISVLSEIASVTGRTINIRKTPPFARISVRGSINSGYFTEEEASFLICSVKAHMNIIICGEPGTGKTELSKFLSTYIPDSERVITIEDNLEWHYEKMKPDADCTAIKTYDGFSTSDAIKHCLRSNPKWLMVAEIRDMDAYDFIKGLSTGVNGITSIHCDNVKKVPERVLNMTKDPYIKEDVYGFVNVGVLVDRKLNEDGTVTRNIAQISIFHDDKCEDVFLHGKRVMKELPKAYMDKFSRRHISNPFGYSVTDLEAAGGAPMQQDGYHDETWQAPYNGNGQPADYAGYGPAADERYAEYQPPMQPQHDAAGYPAEYGPAPEEEDGGYEEVQEAGAVQDGGQSGYDEGYESVPEGSGDGGSDEPDGIMAAREGRQPQAEAQQAPAGTEAGSGMKPKRPKYSYGGSEGAVPAWMSDAEGEGSFL